MDATTMEPVSWDELCPDVAVRYYEGDDPEGFAAEMLELFGIDVRAPYDPGTGLRALGWDELIEPRDGEESFEPFPARAFFIPAGLVEAVYGSDRWDIGS